MKNLENMMEYKGQCAWGTPANKVDYSCFDGTSIEDDELFDDDMYEPFSSEIVECSNPECPNTLEGPNGYVCSIYTPSKIVEQLKEMGYK
jgi:hypothetical protein